MAHALRVTAFAKAPLDAVLRAILHGGAPQAGHPYRALYDAANRLHVHFSTHPVVGAVQNAKDLLQDFHGLTQTMQQGQRDYVMNYLAQREPNSTPMNSHVTLQGGDYSNNAELLQRVRAGAPLRQVQSSARRVYAGNNTTLVKHGVVNSKIKYSTITFVINTNRQFRMSTPQERLECNNLIRALLQAAEETLAALRSHGAHMKCWRLLKNGTLIPNMPWDATTVLRTKTGVKAEVGPRNGYLHLHVYVGIQHRIMVHVNRDSFKAALLQRMEELRLTTHPFGDQLAGLFVGRFKCYRGDIDNTFRNWEKYVMKEIKENAAMWDQIEREREEEMRLTRVAYDIGTTPSVGLGAAGVNGNLADPLRLVHGGRTMPGFRATHMARKMLGEMGINKTIGKGGSG